ncbi:TonB-dependent siderophore receptor [Schauerella aestuarii]|uniref:TonB-dependent siderophore receptor n=1 Tax=Schauerella aestuarii TaxID=2511204 RepID=UPI001370260C|nr:TonB-dependent siderophore receptor [Achromobacter aestuarii]MYZ45356.1 TonB-dependent siderophore receptor [Achromobacter aestuarii]
MPFTFSSRPASLKTRPHTPILPMLRALPLLRALQLATLGTSVFAATALANAQTRLESPRPLRFDVAPGPLPVVLARVASMAGVFLAGDAALADGHTSAGLHGVYSAPDALARVLAGTGLVAIAQTPDAYILQRASSAGIASLAPVTVTGVADATTEDTGGYAAPNVTIGKSIQALREIPQSITVVTRQQMDDERLTTLNQVLEATNGATVVKSDDANERSEIFFRGFRLDSVKVDGVSVSSNNEVTTFDTAIYDRVEILRGPAGVLQGAGEPSGTVNLVRKRAPGVFSGNAELSGGSWDRQRAAVDLGGPIVASGAVRGRLVAVTEKTGSYIDLVNAERQLVFGTLDMDLGERTTLTLGGTHQNGDSRDSRGLPTYTNGELLNVARSTFIGPDWAHNDTRATDLFANLEHRFGGGAVFALNGNLLDRRRDSKLAFADSPVDRMTGNTTLLPQHRIDTERNQNVDASLSMPFDVGGLEQQLIAGAEYHNATQRGTRARAGDIVQNVFNPDHGVAEPDFVFDRFDQVDIEQYGVYGQSRIKPVAWGTIVLGGRMSWWDSTSFDRATRERTAASRENGKFTPYAGVVVDLSQNLSAYGSVASIFVPQQETTVAGSVLPARQGKQYELGLKGDADEGRLTGRLAIFQIDDENRAVSDPVDDDYFLASGKVRSRGFEAEAAGAITPAWQIAAGYTYLSTAFREGNANEGAAFETRAPKHAVRVSTKYTLQNGPLQGLDVGGAFRAYTRTYSADDGPRIDRAGFATLDLRLGYRFSKTLSASLNVTNLLDKKYYASTSYTDRQNYFGDPRAVWLGLRAQW